MGQLQREPGRAIAALILIGLGVLFLLGQFFSFNWFGVVWPFFIIAPGLVFLYFAFTGGRDATGLAIPGALITGTGAILLFQIVFDKWESWAYIWTLYPVFLGLGLMYIGRRTDSESSYHTGRGFVTWGLLGFVIFGAFFELFIFGGFGQLGRYVLPGILILVGLWMLLRTGARRSAPVGEGGSPARKRQPADEEPVFTGAPVVGQRPTGYAPSASERLRQEIDAALAEEAAPAPAPEPDEPGPGDEDEPEPEAG